MADVKFVGTHDWPFIISFRPSTPEEIAMAARVEQESKDRFERNRKYSVELKCDACGVVIGYVAECDLNGSYFFCKSCKEKP